MFAINAFLRRGLMVRLTRLFSWTGWEKEKKPMPPSYRHFTQEEAAGIEPDVMAMLDVARERAGVPFVKTCGLRTPEHNAEVGGEPNSDHLPDANGLSWAVDLACDNSSDRWKMVFALEYAGFRRIVLEPRCIHVDADPTEPQMVLALWERQS